MSRELLMAKLTVVEKNETTHDKNIISRFLSYEKIPFGSFNLSELAIKNSFKNTLTEEERKIQIDDYSELSGKYEDYSGYRADMICLYPEFDHLTFVLSKFKDIHFHFESEHWYITDGSLGFGFLSADGHKFTVDINQGEYITVPEGKWQWLIPPKNNRLKAIRFFTSEGFYKENTNPLSEY